MLQVRFPTQCPCPFIQDGVPAPTHIPGDLLHQIFYMYIYSFRIQTVSRGLVKSRAVVGAAEPETNNDCVGEGQQKITRPRHIYLLHVSLTLSLLSLASFFPYVVPPMFIFLLQVS
jgi:hypothetical protein